MGLLKRLRIPVGSRCAYPVARDQSQPPGTSAGAAAGPELAGCYCHQLQLYQHGHCCCTACAGSYFWCWPGFRNLLAGDFRSRFPGVAALDILDNVIPYIPGEEDKIEVETLKILGEVKDGSIQPADIQISTHTNRVAVSDGHMVCLSIGLRESCDDLGQIIAGLQEYRAPESSRGLPSAPNPVIYYHAGDDRPQPKVDRMHGNGMNTSVGRLRTDPILDLKLVILSHNTIRGAAGGSIYNAELLVQEGYLS